MAGLGDEIHAGARSQELRFVRACGMRDVYGLKEPHGFMAKLGCKIVVLSVMYNLTVGLSRVT